MLITVNGICLFCQLNSIWEGGWKQPHFPPKISKTVKVWLCHFYQMLVPIRRHKSKILFDITNLICKLQTKIPKSPFLEMQLPGMLTSRNLAGLSILISEMNHENLSSLSHYRQAILQNSLLNAKKSWLIKYRAAMRYKLGHETKFTLWCHGINIWTLTKFQVFLLSRTEIHIS